MAAAHGRKTASIKNALLETPERFSLAQAIRLLALEHESEGQDSEEARRRVRIVPWLSLAYPSSEIRALTQEAVPAGDDVDGETEAPVRYRLETTLFGLYSTQGPLPTLYTEELLDEARFDQSVIKGFLDIINNRLTHYLCQADLHNNHPRRLIEHTDTDVELVLNSLMGQAYPALRPTDHPHPQAAELLAGPRTAGGLANYLAFEFGWPQVEVEECVPRQARIPKTQHCRLGRTNSELGVNLMLGDRIWDVSGKIRIHLRNLPEARLQSCLHGNPGHTALLRLARCYMNEALAFDIVLHPNPRRTLENHALGGGLRIGAHLLPSGQPARQSVTIYPVAHSS
ncbi:MAG: type VI secretion system baseplate subunit TssG [Candidatus Accumulibacter sp.]|jgi:type VI secretion system protein ImpH|nr:type VI secretion system baseplate subunit TssG [Accumulibacter sp.]